MDLLVLALAGTGTALATGLGALPVSRLGGRATWSNRSTGLLPFSFAFAGGAMLALVVFELVPEAFRRGSRSTAVAGTRREHC